MDVAGLSPSTLVTQKLCLSRGGRPVLFDVDATFERSNVTAIVGPSGAGKTSLLRCLNRLEDPDSGSVLLDGRDIKNFDPTTVRKRIGMIFQTPALFEGGVRANLAYGLTATDDDRLAKALTVAGLPTSFLDRESTALSVGQAQRVCIARALTRDPEVILMDEPTSALDKDAAARVESLIVSLAERDLAIVLVTHNLEQAQRVASRALLLVDGRIIATGPVDEIENAWPGEA
ncbi:MAG: UDP-glucose/iron transport system ATP-binding protein [Actinomycetota bacterium]|nr:UDP-glucose/iron transport system ATP-binding protein [Actinomycetota bacterium]